MKNTQNVTIAVLTVTACILLAMVLGSLFTDRALAGSSAIKQGDYIMVTGVLQNNTDMLYVIDRTMQRMAVYLLTVNGRTMELMDSVDLKTAFTDPVPPKKP